METASLSFSLMLLILSSVTLSSCTRILNSTSIDQDALLAFKNGVASDPYSVLSSNWFTNTNTSICYWTGVSCGLKHRRVTALNLSGCALGGALSPHLGNLTFLQSLDITSNFFTGSIPSELSSLRRLKLINAASNNLTGEIPLWLAALSQLQYINLANNDFNGKFPSRIFTNMSSLIEIDVQKNKLLGQLPNGMCHNTPNLRRIYLTGNQLSGPIPAIICNCTELEDLWLEENQFTGKIPSEIGNLTVLRNLVIYSNFLEGIIPSSIFNISSLEYLSLYNNNLSGSIPAFTNLPRIEALYLNKNRLTGGVPKEFGHLTSLQELVLHDNNFTGYIPKQLGNVTALRFLDLSVNKLAGELPEELGNLVYLEDFSASFNDHLSGPIPHSIFNISSLKVLSLQQNQFSGSLPSNIGLSLSKLQQLSLFLNKLSGEIPSSITNASMLTILELNRNSFTGSIPDFGNLRRLQVLRLWENNLTGAESPNQELTFLSSLTKCRDLENLEIQDNPMMNGILPASVGNLSTSLITFAASNCSIRGAIPSGIGSLSSLQSLDLSNNQLTGFIPKTLGKLKQLGFLNLNDNQLQGYIPRDLCQMSNLVYFHLSGNMLRGSIPECLGEVESLIEVSLDSNKLNSTLPLKLFNLSDLTILDLSSNYLSGELPDQIERLQAINWLSLSSNKFSGNISSSIGRCNSLEYLYLSNNMFNGSIPLSMGEVKGLRELDISNNSLSGSIPRSLAKLDLEQFNASYNKLEGEIPDEGSFAKLDAYSFLNNSFLCGSPRFQVLPCGQSHGRSSSKSVWKVMKYSAPAFVATMVLVVGIIFLIRRRRPKQLPPATDFASVGVGWKLISERELKQGSDSFSEANLLGRGGMSSVFKTVLADGTYVAVKVFNLELEGATKSFEKESQILSTIRHRNLVKILGCCTNPEFKALILAYMPNGSLDKWLYSDKYCLNLVQRLNIAMDVALALEYLHHDHTHTVVHCDIKPNNVLLDADMTAHVADFGISKLFDNGEAAVHTINMATIGYAAPEFGSEGKVSTSGDVYSYGILLLEMFTSKKPTDDMFNGEISIKEWVENSSHENAISQIMAPGLVSREDPHFPAKVECVVSVFELAMKCVAFSHIERINMKQVVAALHKIKAKVPVEEVKKKHQRR